MKRLGLFWSLRGMTFELVRLDRRHLAALATMAGDRMSYLVLGELPRGIGHGIMHELMRQELVEMGISHRFPGKAGWRITARGLEVAGAAGFQT
ncbi:hypothetical protein EJV46_16045 [Roseococcus sp. SYP-B2431]|uniref:hypothetical protein n=1 Tax=Roseococcus sp. SYP-B2431 TaxID=2496640 RepID=UPI00103A6858|nr:hypothetical protein [Roseococcus sp. SYP-B2431]TCH97629.1 hypothetical protein EJV46_16045 [Roseococcus sp. SYP-B2431]